MQRAVDLLRRVFMNQLSIPALNKWTTVSPCATIVAAMQHFCGGLPQGFPGSSAIQPSPLGGVLPRRQNRTRGAALGQPIDQTRV